MKRALPVDQRTVYLVSLILSIVVLCILALTATAPVQADRLHFDNPTATALQATIFFLQTRNAPSPQTADLTSTAQMATIQALSGTQAPPAAIEQSKAAIVTDQGDELYVLASPKAGTTRLAVLLSGDLVLVKDGPRLSNGDSWWQVQLLDGHNGWVVDGQNGEVWLTGSTDTFQPAMVSGLGTSYLFIGARVVKSVKFFQPLAVRDSPGRNGQVVKYLPVAQDVINREVLLVVGGPVATDGVRWWKVRYATQNDPTYGQIGWVAEGEPGLQYLEVQYPVDRASNVRGGHLKVGDTVRVTSSGDGLKLRTKASRTAPAVTTLGQQVNATVLDGPLSNEGDVWWLLQRSDGSKGWATALPGWLEVYSK